jgi:hypothetical protein
MMSQTVQHNSQMIQMKWKLEILSHVAVFEQRFPELRELAHTPTVVRRCVCPFSAPIQLCTSCFVTEKYAVHRPR